MTNTVLLAEKIVKSGKKKNYLAHRLNVSGPTLRLLLNGTREFNASQMITLSKELNFYNDVEMFMAIFFNDCGSQNET